MIPDHNKTQPSTKFMEYIAIRHVLAWQNLTTRSVIPSMARIMLMGAFDDQPFDMRRCKKTSSESLNITQALYAFNNMDMPETVKNMESLVCSLRYKLIWLIPRQTLATCFETSSIYGEFLLILLLHCWLNHSYFLSDQKVHTCWIAQADEYQWYGFKRIYLKKHFCFDY